ncbi:protein translocase subunit [Saitoella coloradoensis]
MAFGFGGSSSAAAPIAAPVANPQLDALKNEVRKELAIAQAQELIGKVNEHCFNKCITAPGSTFSTTEQGCVSSCMKMYLESTEIVSRTYIARVQKERAAGAF